VPIHHEQRGHVALVTIDRPERRNALDRDALDGLLAAFAAAAADPKTRVLVLTGAEGHFCAGADLSGVEDRSFAAAVREVLVALRDTTFPTIAAVDGNALGAGTQLAVACDLRVATVDARFGVPAGKLGLMVDQWTVSRIAALAGQGPARAMLLGGELIGGDAALRTGFVQRSGDLDEALGWADEIAALAPLTLAGHKVALNAAASAGGDGDPAVEAAFARAWESEDLQEGLAAFRERRRPTFHGH
jgi:enoyl-CoA hydratase